MNILFVHQNFPGQFPHLAPALMARGHDVMAMTASTNARQTPIATVRYKWEPQKYDRAQFRLATTYAEMSERGATVARVAQALIRDRGYVPDVIVGHLGWGETLYLKEVWPAARLVTYAEFYYRTRGLDTDFDPEFRRDALEGRLWVASRRAHLTDAIIGADALVTPTRFQADTLPEQVRDRVTVIHDGIDTDRIAPDPAATVTLAGPAGPLTFDRGCELLTFVDRNLEPYRGYHVFMRALPRLLAERPEAQVVIVGGSETSYGPAPAGGRSWKEIFLAEVEGRIDARRVHFVGRVPYDTFLDLMRVTRVHAYLTYPFVLSWSMLEAMAAGALVVGSRTAPVEEVIRHGDNGLLVDFFDVDGWSATLAEALAEPTRFDPLRAAARATVREGYDLRTRCLPEWVRFVEGMG